MRLVGLLGVLLMTLCVSSAFARLHSNITVSGISSGGFMAVQFHVAYSASIDGSGIIAGGPYFASQGSVITALDVMNHAEHIDVPGLIAQTYYAASLLSIDKPDLMAGSQSWVFSGTKDTTVAPAVVTKLVDYFTHFGVQVKSRFDIPAAHAFPTASQGNKCEYLGANYINNCSLDTPLEVFKTAYSWLPNKLVRGSFRPENLIALNQAAYIPSAFMMMDPALLGLQRTAYAYIPSACRGRKGGCPVHAVFHGCQQTLDHLDRVFIMTTGYNEWAEALGIVILYPQAKANTLNPKGCFDWWGFSGADFATQLGPQMGTTMNMILALKTGTASAQPSSTLRVLSTNEVEAEERARARIPMGAPCAAAGPAAAGAP